MGKQICEEVLPHSCEKKFVGFCFYINQFSENLLFRIIAIFMHVKQRKILRHKKNYDFCTKQIII